MKMRLWCRRALALAASFLFALLLFTVPAYAAVNTSGNQAAIPRIVVNGVADIYLPVTIHDYAADGMLFEWNNRSETGTGTVNKKRVHYGNNDGFSLLTTSAASHQNVLASSTISGSAIQTSGSPASSTLASPKVITLPNDVKETIFGGQFRTGLVEPVLGPDRKPVYRKEVVDFLADYLSKTLPEPLKNSDSSENMWYVMGAELEELGGKSLSSILRTQILTKASNARMGSYTAAKNKAEAGGLKNVYDVTTYYEAAYFLLSDLFCDSAGYGKTVDVYDNIRLMTDWYSEEDRPYTFYSGYSDTIYDTEWRFITNTQLTEMDQKGYSYGLPVPENAFDPLDSLGYGNQNDPYSIYMGDPSVDDINHNLALESHGKFIYHEADKQYFNFTGDGDAYLYINGILSLDMGGFHPISKAGIELNVIADRLGLVDGEMYDFDFFYLDRQGKHADFGIETNILISDPALLADLKAFQDQKLIGYGGSVDPGKPVTYQYSIENRGKLDLTGLSITDICTNTYIDEFGVGMNDDTSLSDLIIEIRNADGSAERKLVAPSEEQVMKLMREGLKVGQKLIIYGIQYQILSDDWTKDPDLQREIFPTSMIAYGFTNDEILGEQSICGYASAVVAKSGYTFVTNHYYDWGTLSKILTEEEKNPDVLEGNDGKYALEGTSAGITMTKKELLQTAVNAGAISRNTLSTEYRNAKIEICSHAGTTTVGNNVNSHAKVQSDGSVFYQTDCSGLDSFFYLVKSGSKTVGPIEVDVYTYGVSNNTYVLDYGLPVELYNDEDAGLTNNDLMSLASVNPAEMKITLTGIQNSTSRYGTFTQKGSSLIYKPKAFMNGTDETKVKVQLLEKGATSLTARTGVVLTQTVTVVPANVVYYEDDFEGLIYIAEDGNAWAMYEGFDENGNSTAGQFQSADQESDYGSDPNYQLDHQGKLTLVEDVNGDGKKDLQASELARYEKSIDGDASNDTIHVLNVQETADVLSFTFAGSGFEIISRTTSEDYCVLSVLVTNTETGAVETQFPVITECKNGDLYQVPVIKVDGLTAGTYQVTLRAAKSSAAKESGRERILYIDGVRIYHPLHTTEEEFYYKSEEDDSTFYEVKSLLQEGQAAVLSQGSDTVIRAGSTYIEDVDEYGFVLKETSSPDEYLKLGPNNELYLNGSAGNSTFLLVLEEIPDHEEKSIQIGVHRKVDASTGSFGQVNLVTGSSFEALEAEEHVIYLESGTENYYSIDPELLDEFDGYRLLLISTTESENMDEILALTNLKLTGYKAVPLEPLFASAMTSSLRADDLEEGDVMDRLQRKLYRMLEVEEEERAADTEVSDEKEESIPTLQLDSLKFKSDQVAAGKNATLLAVTDPGAESLVVLDAEGKEITFTKAVSKQKDGKNTHTVTWKVEESSGQELIYTVYGQNEAGERTQKEEIPLKIK